MDKKKNNILKAYGADNSNEKKDIINKLLEKIEDDDTENLIEVLKSFSKNNKSQEVDLSKIKRIIKEID
ncbi:MAG: hypothetical protein ACE364_04040 [Chlorobiota bacterium]